MCGTQEYLASIHIKHLDDSQVYYEATLEWKGVADTEKQSSDVSVGIPGRSQRLGLSLHLSPKQRFSREHPGQYVGSLDVPRPNSRVEIVAAMRRIRMSTPVPTTSL
ncbi:hypothetical protein ACRRTK_004962 [Alexandromys fortis]